MRRQFLDFDYDDGRPARCGGVSPLLWLAIALVLILAGCGEAKVPRGSAQDLAAGAAARADSNARAADAAAVEAARKAATAAALERAAKDHPTEARIAAAADARVEASAAKAVAEALDQQRSKASDEAQRASTAAAAERLADAKAAADASWLFLCRCFGLAGVALGGLLGGLLGWLATPRIGALVGGLIVGTGLLVAAYGATVTWLPFVLAGAVAIGFVAWAVQHWRDRTAGVALSRTVDALGGEADVTAATAKADLGKVLAKTGLQKRFDRVRTAWRPAIPAPPVAAS